MSKKLSTLIDKFVITVVHQRKKIGFTLTLPPEVLFNFTTKYLFSISLSSSKINKISLRHNVTYINKNKYNIP